jgi:hypothetical protein
MLGVKFESRKNMIVSKMASRWLAWQIQNIPVSELNYDNLVFTVISFKDLKN